MATSLEGSDAGGMRKHYTKAQRAELVALVARGEATPRSAAARLGVSESTAYYWLKRNGQHPVGLIATAPRPRPTAAPAFARLVPATEANPAITVRVGDAVIAVGHHFDAELLVSGARAPFFQPMAGDGTLSA
jgi:transposase-like protein